MAKAEKKVAGVLPKQGAVGVILTGLIAAAILALVWGWILKMGIDETTGDQTSWLVIVELLVLAAIIGIIVGLVAKEVKTSTLWIAAGLGVLAVAWAQFVAEQFMYRTSIDDTVLGSMQTSGINLSDVETGLLSVSIGTIVLGAVAAASVSLAKKIKL